MPTLVVAKRDGFYDGIYRKTGTQFSVSDDVKFEKDGWFEKVKLFKSGKPESENVTVFLTKSPEGQLQGKTHSTEELPEGDKLAGGVIKHEDVKASEKHDHKHDKK